VSLPPSVGNASEDPALTIDPASATLTSPRTIRALLDRHGLRADKRFGQHFLTDPATVEAVVRAADVGADDEVWEVGPGIGVLTRALAARARRVVSVELDARLLPLLAETLAGRAHVDFRHGDALALDLNEVATGSVLAANLPYNVGTAILIRALTSARFRRIGVLVQLEVAERLVAAAGSAAYGSLSLLVAHHGRAKVTRRVPPGAFVPAPAVTSAVVAIELDPEATPDPSTFTVVRCGFRHRRKTLLANLRLVGIDANVAQAALTACGLDPRIRAEALDLATFRALAAQFPADTLAAAAQKMGAPT